MLSALRARQELVVAAWRTWGPRGLARRTSYEVATRAGRVRAFEERWSSDHRATPRPLRSVGISAPPGATSGEEPRQAGERALALYGGGVVVPLGEPILWHRHPLTGHDHDPAAHWSTISDAAPEQGDIKDIWDRSRLGWLTSDLRRWALTGDDAVAEDIWAVIEDWHRQNPPYLGPNWMCGQETSLRSITTMLVADALRSSPTSTPTRQALISSMVRDAVGRVRPTLGYALSQRNNHAISEAGFLWTASLLAPDLPDAAAIRAAAASALAEAVADQFAADGSYAQHSPTYQRLALHVLLWVLAVSRATDEPAPAGVADAVRAGAGFLASLVAPGSEGEVPNLGGNDGALLFDLVGAPISDLRPVIVHAAAATGEVSPFGPGPWDGEATWFGLDATPERRRPKGPAARTSPTVNVHPLTRERMHAVLRAGPLRHRPGHADQLHVDVWIDGSPLAHDPGSYRYTAPDPWGNALAGEEVHNVPTSATAPQAVRAGRFFWRTWRDATVSWAADRDRWVARTARLDLADGTTITRLVAVSTDLVAVVDQATNPVSIRWNLPPDAQVEVTGAATTADGPGWRASFVHDDQATRPERHADDPASGWHAPRYGELQPSTVLRLPVRSGRAAAVFVRADGPFAADVLARSLTDLDLDGGASTVMADLERMVTSV